MKLNVNLDMIRIVKLVELNTRFETVFLNIKKKHFKDDLIEDKCLS